MGIRAVPRRNAQSSTAALTPLSSTLLTTLIRDLVTGALDLIFAPICVACSRAIPSAAKERGICGACWSRARPLPLPRCDRCWTPLIDLGTGQHVPCAVCPDLRPAIRFVRSAFLHEGPVKEIIHSLKYGGWSMLPAGMGRRMSALDLPAEISGEVNLVVPVPISRARLRQRGYNQADLLGNEIARLRGWSCVSGALVRTRSRGTQTALHRMERRANVVGAFDLHPQSACRLQGEHVLVVDDVWTTGATAIACADTLLSHGARAVSVLTFARALPELERHSRRLELIVLQ